MSDKIHAVYAGTFDPPTDGHFWVIQEAAKIFGRLTVLIAVNPAKRPDFSPGERAMMLASMSVDLPNVEIQILEHQFVANRARDLGASVMVRGIRNVTDFAAEQTLQTMNLDIDAGVRTVFLMPPPSVAEVSSSAVKSLIGPEGWERIAQKVVPQSVLCQIIGKRYAWVYQDLVRQGLRESEWEFWNARLKSYFSGGRYYHDISHISEGLNELSKVKELLKNPGLTGLAFLFHDDYYDVTRNDNEENSADVAREYFLRRQLKALAEPVAEMVLATKHHESADYDTQALISADLSILGKSPRRFDRYVEEVECEYRRAFTHEQFMKGRREWTQRFLTAHESKPIYPHPSFEDWYGTAARENLARWLEANK